MTLYTTRQFVQAYPFETFSGLRWKIFNQKRNGLAESGAIIRDGRRILIDDEKYLDWIRTRNISN